MDGQAGGPRPPVRHRHRRTRIGEAVVSRLTNLEPLDVLMFALYIGMTAWGVVAQFEPPLTLVGAAGPVLAHVVTLGVLVFSLSSAVALVLDQGDSLTTKSDIELPMLAGFLGAWGTYATTAWLLIAGLGPDGAVPVLKVFALLTTVMLTPFVVRFVTLIVDATRIIKAARRAQALGIVDEKWNTVR